MNIKNEANRIKKRIQVALGNEKADLLIKNANVVNVFTRTVSLKNIAIVDGIIAGLYDVDCDIKSEEVKDIQGKFVIPGLIDAHTHVEMAYVCGVPFAEGILPWGTTTVVLDPHDTSNVMGNQGVELLAKELETTPLKVCLMTPPCVPSAPILEDAGFEVTLESLSKSMNIPKISGIAEAMDFGRVLSCEPEMMDMLAFGRNNSLLVDGHAPEVRGKDAMAYFGTGPIRTDHESVTVDEMYEKYELGVHVIIRRGSLSEPASAGELVKRLSDTSRLLLSTDGCINVADMVNNGHMNYSLKQIVAEGVDPMIAVQMATINVARAYRLDHKVGAIAPGYEADIVIVEDLKDFVVNDVYLNGRIIDKSIKLKKFEYPKKALNTINLKEISPIDLELNSNDKVATVNVIEMIDGTIATTLLKEEVDVIDGKIQSDINKDILKGVVLERYGRGKGYSVGLVKGFGLKKGALAGSIGQDTQNMACVGVDDKDIALAINTVTKMQGGIALVADGKVLETIPMPIFGIMTEKPFKELIYDFNKLQDTYKNLGGTLSDAAFTLSLQLTLAVIPEGGLTNKGLVDVLNNEFVDVIC